MEIKYRIDLYKLLPPSPVTVELGVAEGYFSSDILENWKPSLHYMVDNYGPIGLRGDGAFSQEWHDKNYYSMLLKVRNFQDRYKILRGPTAAMSEHVKDNSVDLVYVDACHWYECVREDIRAWWPKLKHGGVMAFHDFEDDSYGVKQAVTEFSQNNGLIVNLIPENKKDDAGAWIRKPK